MPYDYMSNARKWMPRRIFKKTNTHMHLDRNGKCYYDLGNYYNDMKPIGPPLMISKRRVRTASKCCQTGNDLAEKCTCGNTKELLCKQCCTNKCIGVDCQQTERNALEEDAMSIDSISSDDFILEPKTQGELLLQSIQRSALQAKLNSSLTSSRLNSKFLISARTLLSKHEFDSMHSCEQNLSKSAHYELPAATKIEEPLSAAEKVEENKVETTISDEKISAAPAEQQAEPAAVVAPILTPKSCSTNLCKCLEIIEEETFITTTTFSNKNIFSENASIEKTHSLSDGKLARAQRYEAIVKSLNSLLDKHCALERDDKVSHTSSCYGKKENKISFTYRADGQVILNATTPPQGVLSARNYRTASTENEKHLSLRGDMQSHETLTEPESSFNSSLLATEDTEVFDGQLLHSKVYAARNLLTRPTSV